MKDKLIFRNTTLQRAKDLKENTTIVQVITAAIQSPTCGSSTGPTIFEIVRASVAKAYADTGYKTGTKKDVEYMVNEIVKKIQLNFKALRLKEIPVAFDRGVNYEYGEYKGLSVVEFTRFIKCYIGDAIRNEALIEHKKSLEPAPKVVTPEEYLQAFLIRLDELFDIVQREGNISRDEAAFYFRRLHKEKVIEMTAEQRQQLKVVAYDKLVRDNIEDRKTGNGKLLLKIADEYIEQGTEHSAVIRQAMSFGLHIWFKKLAENKLKPADYIRKFQLKLRNGVDKTE